MCECGKVNERSAKQNVRGQVTNIRQNGAATKSDKKRHDRRHANVGNGR